MTRGTASPVSASVPDRSPSKVKFILVWASVRYASGSLCNDDGRKGGPTVGGRGWDRRQTVLTGTDGRFEINSNL